MAKVTTPSQRADHLVAGVLVDHRSTESDDAALRAVCAAAFGSTRLHGHRFAVIGLGRVGGRVAELLAAAGADLVLSDVDPDRRRLAGALGAGWLDPLDAVAAEVDVLVPAALGGLLTGDTVPLLRCAAVAGPANNQLATPDTADLLHQRGILWAPNFVVNAGGVIHATAVELHHETPEQAARRVDGIGDTVVGVLATARRDGTTPLRAALELARRRLAPPAGGTLTVAEVTATG